MQRTELPLSGQLPQRDESGETTLSPFMPISEAAVWLDVSPDHVRRAFIAGKVPGMQFGTTYRISRAFIEALVARAQATSVDVDEFAAQWLARGAA